MGVVFEQSYKTTIISILGAIIGYVNVLWLFPAALTPDQIGLIRLLPSIVFLIQPFCQLGLAHSVIRYSPRFIKYPTGQKELLSFILIANAVGFGVSLILIKLFQQSIIEFFEEKSAMANEYFYIVIILLAIITYNSILESFSKSILKIVFPGLIKDVVIRLSYSVFITLFFFEIISFDFFVNGLILIYTIGLLLLLNYLIRKGIFRLTSKFRVLNRGMIKDILSYSLFTVLGATGNYAILHIDQIMLSNMDGLASNGIYTTAYYIAVIIELPKRAISQISLPLISRSFVEKDFKAINKLYKQVSINQMIVGSLLLIGILVNLENLFGLVPNGEIYAQGMTVVLIIGLAKLIDMSFSVNNEVILMSDHYRYNILFSAVLGVIAVILNWLLIPYFGMDGAAIATALSLTIFNLIKLLFIKLKLGLWPFSNRNITLLIIAIFTYIVIGMVPFLINIYIDLILRSAITVLIFFTPVVFLKLSPEINSVIAEITGFKFLSR